MQVPKIAFTYWEGNQLSILHYYTLFSFNKFNPDFSIVLYTSNSENEYNHPSKINFSDSETINLTKIKSIPNVLTVEIDVKKMYNIQTKTTPVHNADIVRIMKLYEHGGIWIDLDILFIKPIPSSILEESEFQYHTYYNTIATGLLVCKEKDETFKYIYDHCKNMISKQYIDGQYQQFGPNLFRQCMLVNDGHDNFIVNERFKKCKSLPVETVYPYMCDEPYLFFFRNEDFIQPNTFGIHWYNGSDQTRTFIKQFNPSNIDPTRNVFEKYLFSILNSE